MTHTKNELGKYSAILNLRFVGNPHICVIQQFKNMEANATVWSVSVTKQECVRISISKFTTFTESTLCPYVVSCFCVDLIQASVHNGTGCFCQDGEHCRSYWGSVAQSFIPVVSCLFILFGWWNEFLCKQTMVTTLLKFLHDFILCCAGNVKFLK